MACLAVSSSGCMCVRILLGVVAFPLAGMAVDVTHPMIDGPHSQLLWVQQKHY